MLCEIRLALEDQPQLQLPDLKDHYAENGNQKSIKIARRVYYERIVCVFRSDCAIETLAGKELVSHHLVCLNELGRCSPPQVENQA